MSLNGRRIPIQVRHETTKITPEMSRAIKRQESNGGFDYWKAGFAGPGSISSLSSDRRPGNQNLSRIHFTFPGVFLPNVDGVSSKLRRRNSTVTGISPVSSQPVMIRRSNSMISSMPSRRIPIQTLNTSRKSVNCDVEDPVLTYTDNNFPDLGLFRSPPNPSRYTEFWEDDTNVKEADDIRFEDKNESMDISLTRDISPGYDTYDSVVSDYEDYEEVNEVENIRSNFELNDIDRPAFPVANGKPYKSILKNSSSSPSVVNKEEFIPQQIKMPSVCSYQLPSPRSEIVPTVTLYNSSGKVTLQPIRPKVSNGYLYNSLRRHQSAKASSRVVPMDYENNLTDVVNDVTTRKRCVRFNVAHQVHEYRPFDPIINC